MPLLTRFDPPAGWTADMLPGQLDAWSAYISNTVDEEISMLPRQDKDKSFKPQFFNATIVDQNAPAPAVIPWQGFPKRFERENGGFNEAALKGAEPAVLPRGYNPYYRRTVSYRPQDEYCEWRLITDDQGRAVKYIFTSEPPEYWEALAEGYPLLYKRRHTDPPAIKNHDAVLQLYQVLVGPQVTAADIFPQDIYDPYNRYNTTDGIVHLTHQANTLGAEINLASRSTVLYADDTGQIITDETQLIDCNGAGDYERASDPHISQGVNGVAAQGSYVTIQNPMGLYITELLTPDSITRPGAAGAPRIPCGTDCWKIVRGHLGQGLRAEFSIPAALTLPDGSPLFLSDLEVDGVQLLYGGQISKKIQMSLTGEGFGPGTFSNIPVVCRKAQEGRAMISSLTGVFDIQRRFSRI